ncbi:hypothetical protein KF707_21620 [Candidatus Obscuribacterales bacterium]|nr:hypothetical protein [Candidatus Obscuribacterales bacterium]MBX3138843.1 hypothetical protein [Candidatus Obscuribacterales bacterium]MBX3152562.1 hypothetical protein [Candidatus Obscuribacterales bacterium]
MIRLSKPVKLLEWGEGTNTTNQRWIEMGTGTIVGKPKTVSGITTVVVELNSSDVKKTNASDDTIKIAQVGEAMTPLSEVLWGEVGYGRLKSISGKNVEVELKVAVKVGR